MSSDIDRLYAHESELRRLRQPYATVKVVWVAPPSSGKPGNAALVTADGQIDGWVGGSCAEPVVIREALSAMEAGLPRLVHLGPSGESSPPRDGVVNVNMSCASEGSLEIFLEPRLPSSRLVVVGRAPVVRALVGMARAIDFDVLVVERDPTGEPWPAGVEVSTDLDLAGAGIGPESYVVVATFGRYDEEALLAALETDAAYIGLVASAKRGATALSLMGSMGTAPEALARIHSPAGLDLGSLPHAHMAVPILAEIVAERSQSLLHPAEHGAGKAGAASGGTETASAETASADTGAAETVSAETVSADTGAATTGTGTGTGTGDLAAPAAAGANGAGTKTGNGATPVHAGSGASAAAAPAAQPAGGQAAPASGPVEVIDPVCGMTVDLSTTKETTTYEGVVYGFCCGGCRLRFLADPTSYLNLISAESGATSN